MTIRSVELVLEWVLSISVAMRTRHEQPHTMQARVVSPWERHTELIHEYGFDKTVLIAVSLEDGRSPRSCSTEC
jgi:hypothetical protein